MMDEYDKFTAGISRYECKNLIEKVGIYGAQFMVSNADLHVPFWLHVQPETGPEFMYELDDYRPFYTRERMPEIFQYRNAFLSDVPEVFTVKNGPGDRDFTLVDKIGNDIMIEFSVEDEDNYFVMLHRDMMLYTKRQFVHNKGVNRFLRYDCEVETIASKMINEFLKHTNNKYLVSGDYFGTEAVDLDLVKPVIDENVLSMKYTSVISVNNAILFRNNNMGPGMHTITLFMLPNRRVSLLVRNINKNRKFKDTDDAEYKYSFMCFNTMLWRHGEEHKKRIMYHEYIKEREQYMEWKKSQSNAED